MSSQDSYFYEDFTNCTAWEEFIRNLENTFTAWGLSNYQGFPYDSEDFDLSWECQSAEPLILKAVSYKIYYYSLKKRTLNTEQDSGIDNQQGRTPCYVSSSIHHIFSKSSQCPQVAYMFDVPEFILVKQANSQDTNLNNVNKTLDESNFNLLLSSVNIAVSNIQCGLPVFVKAGDPLENFYEGVYVRNNCVGAFQMIHLAKAPEHCLYLSGILDVFKSKIKSNRSANISVSSCLTYTIPNDSTWLGFKQIKRLPLGLTCNPICGIRLSAIWFDSSERLVVDTSTSSGFEPQSCNYHRISLISVSPAPQGRLAALLHRILELSVIGLSSPAGSKDLKDFEILPILGKDAHTILDISDLDFCSESFENAMDVGNSYVPCLSNIKTAPPDSLVHALALMILRSVNDSKPAVPEIWGGFVKLLREHWKNCSPISGVKDGPPDHNTCVLNQKLQMLNFCIQRKAAELAGPDKFFDADLSDEESEKEEEFIECKDKSESEDAGPAPQPEGRKEIVPGLLTVTSGEPIYAPFVQEAIQLEEDVLERRGTELHVNLTLSYMEAFKAANPSASFRDFIRWFSPRDWIEEDTTNEWGQKTGHLSDRMLLPGNKWISMWTKAKPKAANQQPSIFDHDTHAEAILQWFDSIYGYKLMVNIIPLIAQKAVERVIRYEESVICREILAEYFTKDLCSSVKNLAEECSSAAYQKFLHQLHEVEVVASLIHSLCDLLKLNSPKKRSNSDENVVLKGAIVKLVSGQEVNLTTLDGRLKASHLLGEYQKFYDDLNPIVKGSRNPRQFNTFPPPDTKEFILSMTTPRPGPNSKPCHQRMYACVNSRLKDELTIAACFTKDIYHR